MTQSTPATDEGPTPTKAQEGVIDEKMLLRVAICAVGYELDLSSEETAQVIGKDHTFFVADYAQDNLDLDTQKLVALLFQLHRDLSARVGHNLALMRRWMSTPNQDTGGTPKLQIRDPGQLEAIVEHFDKSS